MPSTIRGSDNFDTAGGNAVKAWVNFNGTGTVAIRASYNVASITDNGTGDFTVNFTTALSDANYAALVSCGVLATEPRIGAAMVYSTSSVRIETGYGTFINQDEDSTNVSVFR